MKKGRRKSHYLPSKELLSLALYRLLRKNKYEEITVKDICEKAGLSRMSFYRMYSNKDDILIDYCDERFVDFFEILGKTNDIDLNTFFNLLFSYLRQYSRQIDKLRETGMESLLLKQFQSYINYLSSKSTSSSLRFIMKNKISSSFLAGGIFMVTIKWSEDKYSSTPSEMAKLTMEMLRSIS